MAPGACDLSTQLTELVERARSQVRDPGGSFILDEDLVIWANEAQTDIAARTEVLQKTVSGQTWAGMGGLSMPPQANVNPEMVEILSLRLGEDDVTFVSDRTFNDYKDEGAIPATTIGRVFEGTIELYPTPAANITFVLRYSFIPAPLIGSDDVLSLPSQMDRKVVEYMVAQAKYKDGDPAEGDRWLARYEQGLPPLNTGRRLLDPGPMDLHFEPNSFELDPGYMA